MTDTQQTKHDNARAELRFADVQYTLLTSGPPHRTANKAQRLAARPARYRPIGLA